MRTRVERRRRRGKGMSCNLMYACTLPRFAVSLFRLLLGESDPACEIEAIVGRVQSRARIFRYMF
jgi:hypothetical protein